jgi:hypothetical protein
MEREAALQNQLQLARAEIIRLKEEIAQYKLERIMNERAATSFSFYKQISICSNNSGDECRCLQIDTHYRTAIISRQSSLIRVSLDANGFSILASHSKQVKAVAVGHFKDGLVASVGLDCRLKLCSLSSASELAEWGLSSPGWSVAFDRLDRNVIFVGLANRRIAVFDTLKTMQAVKESILVDSGSPPLPIHSLFMAAVGPAESKVRVLVGATMNGIFVSEPYPQIDSITSPIIKTHSLDTPGLCSGLTMLDQEDHNMFCALFRQAEPSEPALLVVFTIIDDCEEDHASGLISIKTICKFKVASGCTRLLSPCIFTHGKETELKGEVCVAVIDEPSSSIHLWSVEINSASFHLRSSLPCNTARPLQSVVYGNGMIGCLSDQQLFLYRCG